VSVKAVGHAKVGLPIRLTVAGSDGRIKEVERNPSDPAPLAIECELPVNRSQWLVASVVCDNGAIAHTSPFYLIVDGRPFWHPTRGPAVMKKQLDVIAKIRAEIDKGTNDERAKGVRARLDKARRFYDELAAEMAGAPN